MLRGNAAGYPTYEQFGVVGRSGSIRSDSSWGAPLLPAVSRELSRAERRHPWRIFLQLQSAHHKPPSEAVQPAYGRHRSWESFHRPLSGCRVKVFLVKRCIVVPYVVSFRFCRVPDRQDEACSWFTKAACPTPCRRGRPHPQRGVRRSSCGLRRGSSPSGRGRLRDLLHPAGA